MIRKVTFVKSFRASRADRDEIMSAVEADMSEVAAGRHLLVTGTPTLGVVSDKKTDLEVGFFAYSLELDRIVTYPNLGVCDLVRCFPQ